MKYGLPLSLILVNVLVCIRWQTWKVYQQLAPVTAVKDYFAARRGKKMLDIYRSAGLLLLLVAVAQGQTGLPANKQEIVTGVIRDADWEMARGIAKANGIDTSAWGWNAQAGLVNTQYSRGEDKLLEPKLQPSKIDKFVFGNWYWIVGAVVVIFLFLQFGGSKEHDATNIHEFTDAGIRVVDGDYHGDDAFEVPDGMHSAHQIVPVRRYGASVGR
jgi:hypothetical protein